MYQCALRGILAGDTPRFPPERPLAWSVSIGQLLHEGRELGSVHVDGLREIGLQNGSVLAKPMSACLALLLLFPVFVKDSSVLRLYGLQRFRVLGHVGNDFVDVDSHFVPPVVHQSDADVHHSDADGRVGGY